MVDRIRKIDKLRLEVFMSKNRGSILLPILLVSTIALAMALAVASRSLKGLKSTGETEQSSSAYSAAEAGIEQALYSVEQGTIPTPITTPILVGAGGYIKELTVIQSGGGTSPYLVEGAVAKDDAAELKLNTYSGSTLSIYWANTADASQVSNPASLIITYVYGNSPYAIKKEAINCTARTNGFTGPVGGTYQIVVGSTTMEFACRYNFSLAGTSSPQIIRLRPMYNKAEILINPDASLPSQMLTIKATGKAGETERTVEVTRSKPSLPAIFDFVLFSGSATQPLTK